MTIDLKSCEGVDILTLQDTTIDLVFMDNGCPYVDRVFRSGPLRRNTSSNGLEKYNEIS